MPTITKGGKVLVSGANGYIAMWVTKILLDHGYLVRGTVRTEAKGDFMKTYFTSLGYADKFEFLVVDDIAKEGAFDEAVKNVDAIEHTASPFHQNVKDPQDFIRPAVEGTVGMLKSAMKNGNQVKRVVITSSGAAVMAPPPIPTVFTESDWNVTSPREVEEQGHNTPPMSIYRASKVLAERAAWEFYKSHKSDLQWDLTVINPPYVFGPPIHDVTSLKSLNSSLQLWYDYVIEDTPKSKETLSLSNSWVDVRDVALAHVLALEKIDAGDERIITTSGPFIWQEWLHTAKSLSPSLSLSHKFPPGFPEILDGERIYQISYAKSKEARIFGIKFRSQTETTEDTIKDFIGRGWLD